MPHVSCASALNILRRGKADFIELGCGRGGTLRYLTSRFGGEGIGFDDNSERLEKAGRSHVVACADITQLELPPRCVRFVALCDVLEHLPDVETAAGVLKSAGQAARDFLLIRHPNFDSDAYLASLGLRFDWSGWACHPNLMLLSDFRQIFESYGWKDFVIVNRKRISTSAHKAIVPLSVDKEARRYNPETMPPKPIVKFTEPVYTQFDIFVKLKAKMPTPEWRKIIGGSYAP